MKWLIAAMVAGLAPLLQVAAAPLFPLDGATPDVVLLAAFALAVGFGPRAAMVALPCMVVGLALGGGRSVFLLMLGYVPLLPLGYALESSPVPLNRFARSLVAVLLTGAWARLLLAVGAYADGAAFSLRELTGDVLISGAILDGVLLTLLYAPFRLAGATGRSWTPARTGWFQ
ncbi:MAG: hypothetical protein ACKVVT_01775 [Dehalococcoidia bacterium]